MQKQKRGFWLFIFSLIPGAGEMYMGFKKQGLSIMLMFWGVLLPQDPDADNVGMMMLAWAFVILLAMLWNIFQTVQKIRNLKNHSANVDRNNQLKQLLNTQIKEAQERISALQQEMQTILNDL